MLTVYDVNDDGQSTIFDQKFGCGELDWDEGGITLTSITHSLAVGL